MREWFKYLYDRTNRGKVFKLKSSTPEEHAKDMGGYHSGSSYRSKSEFFENWYLSKQSGRLETYNNFVQRNLDKKTKVLSLARGRCAGELYLLEQGFNIVCSDLRELGIHGDSQQLFPLFKFFPLDILQSSSREKYDAITAFSLLYLFTDDELKLFFKNVSSSLSGEGILILDPGGASDNRITLFMDEFFLKCENWLVRVILFLLNKPNALIVKHQGFRRTDNEIIAAGEEAGFVLVATEYADFLTEFRRSRIFRYLLEKSDYAEKVLSIIGKKCLISDCLSSSFLSRIGLDNVRGRLGDYI